MIKNINILMFFIFSFASNAQNDEIQKEVIKLFPSSVSGIKIINLTGYKDGGIEIRLYLVNNNDEWKGICYYPSSQERIILEGGLVKGKLILDETDRQNETIGMWLIDLNDYKAKWRNIAGNKSFAIQFYKQKEQLKAKTIIAQIYRGKILNDDFEIILSGDFNKRLNGNFININQKSYLKNNIQCDDPQCDTFTVDFKNNKIKKLICNIDRNKNIEATVISKTGTNFKSKLRKTNELKLAYKTYINNRYSLIISYPVFENKKLNNSFNKELNQIVDSLEEEMEKIFYDNYDYDNRLILQVNGWFDIDYYSNDIFSGNFIIQKSYSDKTKCLPVVLSLKTGKKIQIQKQFSSDFNFEFYSKQFLKEYIKNLHDYKSAMIRNYLKPENFKCVTINKSGIVFSTDFSSIFGIYKIILPYSEIQKDIKRRSILQKIIKL